MAKDLDDRIVGFIIATISASVIVLPLFVHSPQPESPGHWPCTKWPDFLRRGAERKGASSSLQASETMPTGGIGLFVHRAMFVRKLRGGLNVRIEIAAF